MSNSTFNVTEPDYSENALTLFISPDGSVTPDKETVKRILNSRASTDINLMTMKKVDAGEVNITMDNLTYVNSDTIINNQNNDEKMEEDMSEISRNLRNFRMDHDYTSLTSPSHVPSGLDMVDELAQTLSMLEDGSLDPQLTNEPLTKITKIVKGKKQTIFVNSKEKQRMINAGLLKERPTADKTKKTKIAGPPIVPPAVVVVTPPATRTTRSQTYNIETPEEKEKELTTPVKVITKPQPQVQKESPEEKKVVKAVEEPKAPTLVDKKVAPLAKKEKKVVKPIPDDFALFSTPDIIRRVGKDKELATPPTPPLGTSPTTPKPAKISPENRSKSHSDKTKRTSVDTMVDDKLADKERRMSLDITKTPKDTATPLSNTPKHSVSPPVTPPVDNMQLEPMPSAEDIRAMIHTGDTKTFTINTLNNQDAELPSVPGEDPAEIAAVADLNIDAASLELDQSLLDNINTDLISEDILYQVAQSLVDNNTELQNAIDKTLSLNDSALDLDTPSALSTAGGSTDSLLMSNESTPSSHIVSTPAQSRQEVHKSSPATPGTTLVRPDGRIVVIPPIERPATRSRNRKQPSQPQTQPKPAKKPLDDQHVTGEELDSTDNEEEESDDDPNKLWCVCNQPHNNRFMICCDTCEEWYHGKCVNVTKALGQQMEAQGKDWMCVFCKDPALKRPKAAMRRMRKASRTSTDSNKSKSISDTTPGRKSEVRSKPPSSLTIRGTKDKEKPKLIEKPSLQPGPEKAQEKKPMGTGCVVCSRPSRNSSIYCSDSCILKHAQGVEKVVVFNRKTGHLLSGSNAPSAANLDKWLGDNPTYEAVRSSKTPSSPSASPSSSNKVQKPPLTQSKLKIVKNTTNPGVSLAVQKKGVNVGVLPHSPKTSTSPKPIVLNSSVKNKSLVGNVSGLKVVSKQSVVQSQSSSTSKTPEVKKVASPSTGVKTSTPVPKAKVQTKLQPVVTKKEKEGIAPQKTPKERKAEYTGHQSKQENLRDTVKKTFFEQLSNRLKNVDDLKLSDDELRQVSNEIESQLYKCFADTGQKYRNKYRSLIFNIKDPKNQTLWRRICEKSVNPYQLVRLSHDDLASQELALWRERETKHQLDMIKKSELELLNCNRQYVFKTHKGETVFEDDRGKDQVTEVIATEEGVGDEDQEDAASKDSKGSNSKHSRRDRERSKERKSKEKRRSKSKDKERKRRSRSRDRRHSERRRSSRSREREKERDRERDRHRERRHKSSRHKKEEEIRKADKEKSINTEKLDKKSKEILEQLVDKQIVPPLEDKLWKQEEIKQEQAALIPPTPVAVSKVESDSDHEPSSTVTIPTPPRVSEPEPEKPEVEEKSLEKPVDVEPTIPEEPKGQEALWKGTINMIDVANISINAYEVSGDCISLGDELPKSLDIVGRISPTTVWDYIGKMKTSNSKSISILRLTATTLDERIAYLSLYNYLSSRQRLGVVKCVNKRVKDFYILPLAAHNPIPDAMRPLTGPGFEDARPSLLVGIIVRDKRKRTLETGSHTPTKRVRVEVVTHGNGKTPGTPPSTTASTSRSYTPPPTTSKDPRIKLPVPTNVPEAPEENEEDMDEPYSPADSDPDTLSVPEPKSRLNASDITSLLTGGVKSSSFLDTGITQTGTFEPFSSKFDGIPGLDTPSLPLSSLELEQQMAELDQKIAAQKAEIDKVSKDLVSSGNSDLESATLANIALPSNLQQILESIKSIGNKTDTPEYQPESATTDLTMPLLLPKLNARSKGSSSPSVGDNLSLSLPKKSKTVDAEKSGSVLSSLSEEDLIKKAAEMLGEAEYKPEAPPAPPIGKRKSPPPPTIGFLQGTAPKKGRLEMSQPPIPGLED